MQSTLLVCKCTNNDVYIKILQWEGIASTKPLYLRFQGSGVLIGSNCLIIGSDSPIQNPFVFLTVVSMGKASETNREYGLHKLLIHALHNEKQSYGKTYLQSSHHAAGLNWI